MAVAMSHSAHLESQGEGQGGRGDADRRDGGHTGAGGRERQSESSTGLNWSYFKARKRETRKNRPQIEDERG